MLKIVKQKPAWYISSVDNLFDNLKYIDIEPYFKAIEQLANVEIVTINAITYQDMCVRNIPIKTQFGYTQLCNIPGSIKVIILAKIYIQLNKPFGCNAGLLGNNFVEILYNETINTDLITLYNAKGILPMSLGVSNELCNLIKSV